MKAFKEHPKKGTRHFGEIGNWTTVGQGRRKEEGVSVGREEVECQTSKTESGDFECMTGKGRVSWHDAEEDQVNAWILTEARLNKKKKKKVSFCAFHLFIFFLCVCSQVQPRRHKTDLTES